MHPTIPTTTATAYTLRKIEIQRSDANQLCLKFVVSYREAAKRKQKVFETEEEAMEFRSEERRGGKECRFRWPMERYSDNVHIVHALKTGKGRRDSKRL